MTRRTVVLGGVAGLVAFHARRSGALESFESSDPRMRLEWQKGTNRKGKPVITGYVYNRYGLAAGNIRIIVEGIDAGGKILSKDVRWVLGTLSNDDRIYFEVTVTEAPDYRVRLLSWDWLGRGGQ